MVSSSGLMAEAVAVEVSTEVSTPPETIPAPEPTLPVAPVLTDPLPSLTPKPVPQSTAEPTATPANPPTQSAPPVWDGVHQLPDGSTVTIKSGVVTPNSHVAPQPPAPTAVSKAKVVQSEPWEGQPIVGDSPCQQLVAQVCGRQDQCAASSACSLARQSLKLEQEERSHSWGTKAQGWGNIEYMTPTSGQCLASLKDQEFFKACGQ